jgi:hypothetical protein
MIWFSQNFDSAIGDLNQIPLVASIKSIQLKY